MNFRLWMEKRNIWGFDDEDLEPNKPFHPGKTPFRGDIDLPINGFNVQRMIEQLAKYDLGFKKSKIKFMNECQWGENPGAVRVIVTPKVNLKIQKLHYDLEGNKVWVMKKYFFIDDANFAGKEDVVANEVFDQVKNINDEQMENPNKDVKLEELVKDLNIRLRGLISSTLLPEHTVRKNSENEFTVFYYLRGGGASGYTGASNTHNVMEVVVNLSKQRNTGLIKAMVTVVTNLSSGSQGGNTWVLMPSDFEEYFMPTQGKREIIESLVTALKTY